MFLNLKSSLANAYPANVDIIICPSVVNIETIRLLKKYLIIGIVFTTLGSSSKLFLLACTNILVAVSKLLERTQAIEEN